MGENTENEICWVLAFTFIHVHVKIRRRKSLLLHIAYFRVETTIIFRLIKFLNVFRRFILQIKVFLYYEHFDMVPFEICHKVGNNKMNITMFSV